MTFPLNSILSGDCLSILPKLPAKSIDFVLADQTYITPYRSKDGSHRLGR